MDRNWTRNYSLRNLKSWIDFNTISQKQRGVRRKSNFNNDFLYYVSHTQQGSHWESNVKTLRSIFSAEFFRHFLLSGEIQRRALSRYQNEEFNYLE